VEEQQGYTGKCKARETLSHVPKFSSVLNRQDDNEGSKEYHSNVDSFGRHGARHQEGSRLLRGREPNNKATFKQNP
jgi:hypothetical protein